MTVSKKCLLEVLLDVRGEQRRPRTGQCRKYGVCSKTRDRQAPPKRDSRTDADTAPHPRISLVLSLPFSLTLFLYFCLTLSLSLSSVLPLSVWISFRVAIALSFPERFSLLPVSFVGLSRSRKKRKRKIRLYISCACVYIYGAALSTRP